MLYLKGGIIWWRLQCWWRCQARKAIRITSTIDTTSLLSFRPPGLQINPYVKLLPMLAGIGSPGTVQEVREGWAEG